MYWILHEVFGLTSDSMVWGLPAGIFIQRVLIPEATVLLIQEDLGQSREAAIETKNQSTTYGNGMFDNSDDVDHRIFRTATRTLMDKLLLSTQTQDGWFMDSFAPDAAH